MMWFYQSLTRIHNWRFGTLHWSIRNCLQIILKSDLHTKGRVFVVFAVCSVKLEPGSVIINYSITIYVLSCMTGSMRPNLSSVDLRSYRTQDQLLVQRVLTEIHNLVLRIIALAKNHRKCRGNLDHWSLLRVSPQCVTTSDYSGITDARRDFLKNT